MADKPFLGGKYIDLAGSLIGQAARFDYKTGKTVWFLAGKDLARNHKRLRSAGIHPETWEIIHPVRAAWAWFQLRTEPTHTYSEARQIQLIESDSAPPDINLELIFEKGVKPGNKSVPPPSPTQQHFSREIRDLGISRNSGITRLNGYL
jgi:hypothetical protein